MARHREFDTEVALTAAMVTFWERGFDGTSVRDLEDSMQLQKGSIYAAFGDKYTIYTKALKHFLDDLFNTVSSELENTDDPLEAIKACLEALLVRSTKPVGRRGLFSTNAVVELGPTDRNVRSMVKNFNKRLNKLLVAKLEAGQSRGSVREDLSASEIASLLTVFISGLSASSRGLTSRADLQRQVELMLSMIAD